MFGAVFAWLHNCLAPGPQSAPATRRRSNWKLSAHSTQPCVFDHHLKHTSNLQKAALDDPRKLLRKHLLPLVVPRASALYRTFGDLGPRERPSGCSWTDSKPCPRSAQLLRLAVNLLTQEPTAPERRTTAYQALIFRLILGAPLRLH